MPLITFVLFSHSIGFLLDYNSFYQIVTIFIYFKTQFLIQSFFHYHYCYIIAISLSRQFLSISTLPIFYSTNIYSSNKTLSRKIFSGILIPSCEFLLPPSLKFHPCNDNDRWCSLPRLVNPGSSSPELTRVENNERRNFDVPLARGISHGTKGLYVMYTEIKRAY